MNVERYDPTTATEGELAAIYEFERAISVELDPETPPDPFELWTLYQRQQTPFGTVERRVVWADADHKRAIAYGYVDLDRGGSNEHLAWADVHVEVEFRRQGLARAVLRDLVGAAKADGRTQFGVQPVEGSDGARFCEALGLTTKARERRSRLVIADVDAQLVDAWIADAATKAPGYSVRLFDGPVPDDDLAAYLEVEATMNDAPRDDLEMDDWVNTPERVRDNDRRKLERGDRWLTLVAVHDATGTFAGFTGLKWNERLPELVWQGGTAVRREHSGHALGRWMKAAMLRELQSRSPAARFVDTWNAGSNQWMLAINDDLGFRPHLWYVDYQAPIEVWERAAAI